MAITCPNCQTQQMQELHFHGQKVDRCTLCGGIWFDHGELNGALSQADNGDDDVGIEHNLGSHLGASPRSCCRCSGGLHYYQLLQDFSVEVEVCHSCTGIWVNDSEREKVVQSPRIQSALEQMNQPTGTKTWLFQFLLRMPVEYNVKAHSTPWMTYLLLALNILIFFGYNSDSQLAEQVFEAFALRSNYLLQGHHFGALLSHMFLHGSLTHLLGNMYFLYVVGDNIEDALGSVRFLMLYLLCGFAAAAAQILSDPGSTTAMVGASGAIAGLFGMYLLWFKNASLTFMFFIYQKKLSPMAFFAIWLALNLFGAWQAQGSVAYWAHIGGFAAGLGLGWWLKPSVMATNPVLAMLNSDSIKVRR
ncbi:rhomboid family intramembrane serine protease [Ferrimonas sp. SCSIO 43195]|uniref:rhomboid family intramembrane serine protease n=1 Tax=Ferrimonas sp. SCSIO 43195 TaxID=2822844 RepID=UPI002076133D|nr:rhomboid family intramembrane serine protease [Ferrimonas sp. SCSIO 43195]USD37489.1 rhomboid family intramembrane serine protease [Ferrimonas sp. SCSIO 43195]